MDERSLRELYFVRRLSMMEIAKELNITQAKIFYWFKKFGISRRSQSESAYIKQNPCGDPFKVSDKLTKEQQSLLYVGLSLYWAEGNKGKEAIRIANLDERMLKVFLIFLKDICRINDKRLRLYVRVYKGFPLESAREYWSKCLNIPEEKVRVYYHSDTRSKQNQQKSVNGIATLEFHNTKLKQWLDSSIDKLATRLAS